MVGRRLSGRGKRGREEATADDRWDRLGTTTGKRIVHQVDTLWRVSSGCEPAKRLALPAAVCLRKADVDKNVD